MLGRQFQTWGRFIQMSPEGHLLHRAIPPYHRHQKTKAKNEPGNDFTKTRECCNTPPKPLVNPYLRIRPPKAQIETETFLFDLISTHLYFQYCSRILIRFVCGLN